MATLKNRLRNSNIKTRMIVLFIILVFTPFLVFSSICYTSFQKYVIKSRRESAYETLNVVSSDISASMKECEQESMSLYYGEYLEWMTSDHSLTDSEKKLLQIKLDSIVETDPKIYSVVLRLNDGSFMYGGFYWGSINLEKYVDIVAENKGRCLWFGTELSQKASKNIYVLGRSLNAAHEKNVAEIYYFFYSNAVTDSFRTLNNKYQYSFLTSEEGVVYYASDETFLQGESAFDLSSINKNTSISSQIIRQNGKRYIIAYKKLSTGKWYCINLIALDDLIGNIRSMLLPFFGIMILYILFLLLMIRVMQRYIFHPLEELKSNMDAYAVSSLQPVEMKETGIAEFQSLSRHFNHMVCRIDDLLKKYRQETEEKNRMEMTMMASQLTPHFIYNALNTLKWMAVLNHQDKIRMVTESLIYIFMSATRTEDNNYTLKDELDLVKNYAVIQQVRFMNFDLQVDVNPKDENCHIRKLMLQPIVENAIVHGLGRGKIKNTSITIKVWTDEHLHIEIRDFGVGFDIEKWKNSGKTSRDHTNIGIDHVEQLIRMEFGDPYHMEIESRPNCGTTVRYLLPIIHIEKNEQSNGSIL